mmetsp:Transcript_42435/g.49512  ORF Transcript_42435/g.49512 Transcript_42435/m.49512 type:complete len:80 (+) Transcript_42435:1860-2099(+)
MYKILDVLKTNRFSCVKGTSGIGKTSLLKEISKFYAERRCFDFEIMSFSLKKCESVDTFLITLCMETSYQIKYARILEF